jgi:hypothetical protein
MEALGHLDDFGRVDDGEVGLEPLQLGPDDGLGTDEDDIDPATRRIDRTGDGLCGGVIAPHGVEGDSGQSGQSVAITSRPAYVPHSRHARCGSFGLPHCSQATVRGASTFQAALRCLVLERELFFLGTAMTEHS